MSIFFFNKQAVNREASEIICQRGVWIWDVPPLIFWTCYFCNDQHTSI